MNHQGTICTGIGIIGAFIASLYGGWTDGMTTLLMFMAIDYIMGLLVAGIWHKSKKTEDGCLESRAGWKGLVRKGVTMLIVLVAARLDMTIGTTMIRDTAVIGFIANEGISIIENAGLMGIPLPRVITNALEVLRKESENAKVPGTQESVMVDPEDPPVIHEDPPVIHEDPPVIHEDKTE